MNQKGGGGIKIGKNWMDGWMDGCKRAVLRIVYSNKKYILIQHSVLN
jgi:hypothetical protein